MAVLCGPSHCAAKEFRASVFKLFPFLTMPLEFDFNPGVWCSQLFLAMYFCTARQVFHVRPRSAPYKFFVIYRPGCFVGILPDLYPRGAWFLSRAWRQISSQIFRDFSGQLNKFRDIVASRPRSHPSIHFSFYHSSLTTPMTSNSLTVVALWNMP